LTAWSCILLGKTSLRRETEQILSSRRRSLWRGLESTQGDRGGNDGQWENVLTHMASSSKRYENKYGVQNKQYHYSSVR